MGAVPFYVSESDLLLLEEYYQEMPEKEPVRFKKILWNNGFDVLNHEVEERTCLHRNWRMQEVYGRMFYSYERLDKKWNQTGAMSLEAVIASMADTETRKEMVEMATIARFEE